MSEEDVGIGEDAATKKEEVEWERKEEKRQEERRTMHG